MKKIFLRLFIFGMLFLFISSLHSETIHTLSGKSYTNATISEVNPAGIVISYDEGVVQIPFSDLDEEIRKKYNYNPKKAQEYIIQQKKAASDWDSKFIAEEKEKQAKQKQALEQIENDLERYRQEQARENQNLSAVQSSSWDSYQQYQPSNYYDNGGGCYIGGWGYYPGNFSYMNPYWWNKFHNNNLYKNSNSRYIPAIHGTTGYRLGSSFSSHGAVGTFHRGGGRK